LLTLRDIIAGLIGAGVGTAMTLTVKVILNNRKTSTSFSQKEIKAGGDVAGRDIGRGK
jgi:hypothetical protein